MSRQFGNLMKQAQVLQEKMMKFQAELDAREFEGQSGGGMVKAVVNGKLMLLSLSISKDVISPDDPDMLQDLVFAAIKAAQEKAANAVKEEMNKMTGSMGLNIPGLF